MGWGARAVRILPGGPTPHALLSYRCYSSICRSLLRTIKCMRELYHCFHVIFTKGHIQPSFSLFYLPLIRTSTRGAKGEEKGPKHYCSVLRADGEEDEVTRFLRMMKTRLGLLIFHFSFFFSEKDMGLPQKCDKSSVQAMNRP